MINPNKWIVPAWAAPQSVKALCTTRFGGVSKAPFDQLNLGLHSGDDLVAIRNNRAILNETLPAEPIWLNQIHGATVSTPASRKSSGLGPHEADASVSNTPNEVLAILTADCMPVLFTCRNGDVVGAAHAGWRGLSGGVLENTVRGMIALSPGLAPQDICAWMGPAIGPTAFEVGEDVLHAFAGQGQSIPLDAFSPVAGRQGKYLVNLDCLAHHRLSSLGVGQIDGGGFCTFSDQERFFSYRRDRITGRFATLIWISKDK